MRSRAVVGVLLVAIAVYAITLVVMGLSFIASGGFGILLGTGILVVLVVSGLLVARELRFGVESMRMARQIAEIDGVPLDTLERDSQGRVDPAAAQIEWQRRKALADAAPQDWRPWFLLGIAYDNAGDRKQARAAIRRAMQLRRS